MPQMTLAHVLSPAASNALTGTSVAPGATPTTPTPLSVAAMVPATWVPWLLSSTAGTPGVMQFAPSDGWTLSSRSGCRMSMPLSMTATVTPSPVVPATLAAGPSISPTPVGRSCAVWASDTGPSGTTLATTGLARSTSAWRLVPTNEKPPRTAVYTWPAVPPAALANSGAWTVGSTPGARVTIQLSAASARAGAVTVVPR